MNITLMMLINLRELHLNDTLKLNIANVKLIGKLMKLEKVFTQANLFCCFVWKYLKKSIHCSHKLSLYSSCSNLLGNLTVKVLFWFFGIFGVLINLISSICTYKSDSGIKIYKYLLTFSDFLTSVYFLAISLADTYYNSVYSENDKHWRSNGLCKALGTVLQFSLIFSMLILFFLTNERLYSILNPLKSFELKAFRTIFFTISIGLSSILAILPLFLFNVRNIFFHFLKINLFKNYSLIF